MAWPLSGECSCYFLVAMVKGLAKATEGREGLVLTYGLLDVVHPEREDWEGLVEGVGGWLVTL